MKSVALPVREIIGGRPTLKLWAVPGYAYAPFSAKFLTGFLKSVTLPIFEIIGGT